MPPEGAKPTVRTRGRTASLPRAPTDSTFDPAHPDAMSAAAQSPTPHRRRVLPRVTRIATSTALGPSAWKEFSRQLADLLARVYELARRQAWAQGVVQCLALQLAASIDLDVGIGHIHSEIPSPVGG